MDEIRIDRLSKQDLWLSENTNGTEVIIPEESVNQLINNAGSRFETPQGTITLTTDNLEEMAAMHDNVTVTVELQPDGIEELKR